MHSVELLAPAKDLEHGRAAILCGADAIYAGAPRFGARAAAGVPIEQIKELCDFAHRFGARVYVAMNTLLFEDELAEAERLAGEIYEAGADALIIQDMAFLRMAGLPPIELHASTQTFNMDAERVRFLSEAGFSRVILERALSLGEIETIHRAAPDIELETFIHGAICVSYSGRCYMSRTMGPRSGNRGVCMQACRLPYNLLDEDMRPILKDKHLLSVQDMNLTCHLENLIDAGVRSFKIEGRLKDIDYVKNIVTWYRRELDKIIASRIDLQRASKGISTAGFESEPRKSFSRGATSYFIADRNNMVASFDTPKSSGEYMGQAADVKRDYFTVRSCAGEVRDSTGKVRSRTGGESNHTGETVSAGTPLNNGDGICFFDKSGNLKGTNINRVENGKIYPNRMDRIAPGTEIYRNYDHGFVSAVERSRVKRAINISANVAVKENEITLELSEGGISVKVSANGIFDTANNPERAEETLRAQISKTGDTIYNVAGVNILWDEPRFVPVSVINELRRDAVVKLAEARTNAYIRPAKRRENKNFPYPAAILTGEENATNSLAEKFYHDHGVAEIEKSYDLSDDLTGKRVMQMRYCLRRETGQCLKENPKYKGKLYIENGLNVYELQFDCAECSANLVYMGKRDKKTAK